MVSPASFVTLYSSLGPAAAGAGPGLTSIVGTLIAGGSALTGDLTGGSAVGNAGRSFIGSMRTGGTSGFGPGTTFGTVMTGMPSSLAGSVVFIGPGGGG